IDREADATKSASRDTSTSAGQPGSTDFPSPTTTTARPSSAGRSQTRQRCTAFSNACATWGCPSSRSLSSTPPITKGPDMALFSRASAAHRGPTDPTRKTALVAGILYLITYASSIPAALLLGSSLDTPNYIGGAG